jgi:hypothetical protein
MDLARSSGRLHSKITEDSRLVRLQGRHDSGVGGVAVAVGAVVVVRGVYMTTVSHSPARKEDTVRGRRDTYESD